MVNYEILYLQEKDFREAIQNELAEFKESSQEIEELLEKEASDAVGQLRVKELEVAETNKLIVALKAAHAKEKAVLQNEVDQLRKTNAEMSDNLATCQRRLVQVENDAEYFESQNRALSCLNSDLEQKIDSVLEELALLQTELEENRTHHQADIENIERLKQQLKDTESELQVQQMRASVYMQQSQFSSPYVFEDISNRGSTGNVSRMSPCSTTASDQSKQGVFSRGNAEGSRQRYVAEKARVMRSKKAHQTYSFNVSEVQALNTLYAEEKKEQFISSQSKINKESQFTTPPPMISPKVYLSGGLGIGGDSTGSSRLAAETQWKASGEYQTFEQVTAENGSEAKSTIDPSQRGRKLVADPLTPITGKVKRYSEERRRLQLQKERLRNERLQMDVDRNLTHLQDSQSGFTKSLSFVKNLIKDIDEKMAPLRMEKQLIIDKPRLPLQAQLA